jgi:nucleoside-diphosphate-sugar epimerase
VIILLTGSSGFLGKHIYLQQSVKVEIVTLGRSGCSVNCNLVSEIPSLPLVDVVLHVAGKAHFVPLTTKDKNIFFEVNVKGTSNLLKGLEHLVKLPKSFVFISSVAVYGIETGININEQTPLAAKDTYGLSKIQAEQIVLDWCKKHNVICTILRLPLLAGQNPPGNLGAMIKGIQKGYYFNIAAGKAKKSMVLAEDVARSILKVAEIGGIYNLTDGYHPSFAELSNHISIQLSKGKAMNMPMWLARIIAKFGDLLGSKAPLNTNKLKKITSDLTFDDTKAREAFGWYPTPVLEGFKINTNAQ